MVRIGTLRLLAQNMVIWAERLRYAMAKAIKELPKNLAGLISGGILQNRFENVVHAKVTTFLRRSWR